jgi:hypothetical protein
MIMMEFSYAAIEEERNCFVITTFEDINSLSKFNICTKCKNLIIDYDEKTKFYVFNYKRFILATEKYIKEFESVGGDILFKPFAIKNKELLNEFLEKPIVVAEKSFFNKEKKLGYDYFTHVHLLNEFVNERFMTTKFITINNL